ncbi:Gmad2 immunoglobulin-like domain-containing protein [Pengzhenrongella phosphoraccumulans]|uniref:Gmad2 immunoglobulin-like domain-containing protein n=1 Tax=Pengzhenrongella phosphoraccumulans TaxID=3114394 RepID=UPI0038909E68
MTRTTNLHRALPRTSRSASARWTVAAVAVVAALTLTGCASGDEPGSQPSTAASADSSASPSASSAPTPSATPVDDTGDPAGTVTLTSPADGATVTGPQVEVTGEGTAFEGNLRWQALAAGTTDVVQEGFTTAGANGTVGPFVFTVELAAGSYTLEIWEPGESDAAGEGAADARRGLVTSTFTVS